VKLASHTEGVTLADGLQE